jgi:hypothetical protein
MKEEHGGYANPQTQIGLSRKIGGSTVLYSTIPKMLLKITPLCRFVLTVLAFFDNLLTNRNYLLKYDN